MSTPIHKPIQILSPQLANQIAAGEVVERPASVVKELVENSLDAGATQIHIEIEQGGQKRILIRDNGKGIAKDQLILALSRHATSKISDIDDLEHITSMGFRGEALASISSVSRLTLTSKPAEQSEAWQAIAEGREMQVELSPAAHPDGTSIEVLDLFFNTPARRKFLRTGKTEFQHIEQIIKRLALTRVDVQFTLIHNQKTVFKYPAGDVLAQRIEQVCGKQMLINSVPVDYYYEGVKLSGWCSQLGAGLATRDLQYTFVNGRMMKDKLLTHALRQVYEETLAPQLFPCYVLYLQVPPEQLDVNVHPAKHEVRFHQARKVHDLVFKAINDAISAGLLQGQNDPNSVLQQNVPTHGYIQALQNDDGTPQTAVAQSFTDNRVAGAGSGSVGKAYEAKYYAQDKPSLNQIKAAHEFYQSSDSTNAQNDSGSNNQASGELNRQFLLALPYIIISEPSNDSPVLKILPIQNVVTLVVSNRINKSTLSQPLLMPVSSESPGEGQGQNFIAENIEACKQDLFDLVAVSNKVILKQVPSELRQLPWAGMFSYILGEWASKNTSNIQSRQARSYTIAQAWLRQTQVNSAMLQGWLSELGTEVFDDLLHKKANTLDLQQWMQISEH